MYRGLLAATAQLQTMGYSRRLIEESSLGLGSDAFKLVRLSRVWGSGFCTALPADQRVAPRGVLVWVCCTAAVSRTPVAGGRQGSQQVQWAQSRMALLSAHASVI